MDIDIATLQTVANKLFAQLLASGNRSVTLPHDYYWFIQRENRYDVQSQPTDFTLGQLSDDYSELGRIERGEVEPLSYALVWLAAVILAVGEEAVS